MSERITIEGREASLTSDEAETHTTPVASLVEGIAEATVRGLSPEPLPDNVKWFVQCGQLVVCIVELTPELRWIKWLAEDSPQPFGPEAVYTERRLATPYVVLKVPFCGGHLVPRVEVFFRNERLQNLAGEGGALCWPNLYNVSVNAYHCTAWYCSQYLAVRRRRATIEASLDAVVHHLFGGGFNASSEFHEGLSTFGLCVKENVDPRVTDVARWEEESQRDPRFVLDVQWKPTGLTVRQLIDRELRFHRIVAIPNSAQAIGNILLRKTKPK